ncbi:tonoplast dicarboxylate transporter-like [Ostrinia furnacalis]|uniref:tonoplast dicarboxylate transporter-like n=1 Tax=Ostrinia furnacalis TaxID=93504 RepID=UPI00103B658B|nr:tonoplast dicarboxylate transporter-like [Ostrinia furnacalis]
MGKWWSKLLGRDQREAIKGPVPRLRNIVVNNFRGILGVIVPIAVLSWQPKKDVHNITVQCMWMWMFWFFLIQPIAVPCTAMIPIFILPMCGVMSTMDTAKCYFNEGVALFMLASMLVLLWNNSGFDRRIALCFLTSGDACQFSGKRLVFKCSMAAYILSMFSNRLIVSSTLTQYITPIFLNLQSSYGKSGAEPNFDEMRCIINNAIQTSSSIGSIAILHSAYATLVFKAVWCDASPEAGKEYPDVFNYLQYSAYAFPVSVVMFMFNVCYHMLLVNIFVRKPMSAGTMNEVRTNIMKLKDSVPKRVTLHEKLTVFFSLFSLLILFVRWNKYQDPGWAQYNLQAGAEKVPFVKDACVAAIFVVALHILPKSFNFWQFVSVDKKSELKDLKPESAILWWRFVDKNINYGYFFICGAAIAINKSARDSGLGKILAENFGKDFTSPSWCVGLFLVCLITCILANFMTGCAALVCILPFVINMSVSPAPVPWQGKLYLAALGVGVGSSLGFMLPFLYTPAYFCHYTGKVPVLKMIKYSFLSVWGCCGILWFSLCYWAPYLWDPNDNGILPVAAPASGTTTTTTEDAGT